MWATSRRYPAPGDYKTTAIGRRPLIVSRHEDGEIYVLLNRCRHRGSVVCREELGQLKGAYGEAAIEETSARRTDPDAIHLSIVAWWEETTMTVPARPGERRLDERHLGDGPRSADR